MSQSRFKTLKSDKKYSFEYNGYKALTKYTFTVYEKKLKYKNCLDFEKMPLMPWFFIPPFTLVVFISSTAV